MRFPRQALAFGLVVAALALVPWAAMAAPRPRVNGAIEGTASNGDGRLLVVFGKHLATVRYFELTSPSAAHGVELPVLDRSPTLVLLAIPGWVLPGDYVLGYKDGSRHRTTAIHIGVAGQQPSPQPAPGPVPDPVPDPVPVPVPVPTPVPVPVPIPTTITNTIFAATTGQAISASSGVTGESVGGIDCTASNGIGIAGHGNIGVLGDVDDGGYGSPRVGVLGSASSYASIGVSGVNDAQGPAAQTGPGVLGRSHNGTGVYGITDVGGWSYYYGGTYYPTGAVGVKALAKGGYSTALAAEAQGANSTGLLVNHTGGSGNVAVFQTDGTNCARIALDGTGYFNGGTVSSGADFAESVAVDAPAKDFEPGDVVVIDPASPRRFALCRTANSPLVAGVVSTRPALLGTVHDVTGAGRDALEKEIRLGIVGIVPTKVCDEGGPVRIGDLLVSASRPGHAKRAPEHPAAGTVVGKALGSLDEGTARIEVLLTAR